MKTLFTAIVALAITSTASATHNHNSGCPSNCSEKVAASTTPVKSYDRKIADLKNVAEEKAGLINYNRAMQLTLNQLNMQKHLDAIANIESETSYDNLMSGVITNLEQQKLDDQMNDLTAAHRYEQVIQTIFTEVAAK